MCPIEKPQRCSVYTSASSLSQQLAIQSLLLQQLCMRSHLGYNSLIQHTDNVCLLHCCQAVCNSDTGTSLSCLVQSCLHHLLIRNKCHTHFSHLCVEIMEDISCFLNLIVVAFNRKEIRPSSHNIKHYLLDKGLVELIIL